MFGEYTNALIVLNTVVCLATYIGTWWWLSKRGNSGYRESMGGVNGIVLFGVGSAGWLIPLVLEMIVFQALKSGIGG